MLGEATSQRVLRKDLSNSCANLNVKFVRTDDRYAAPHITTFLYEEIGRVTRHLKSNIFRLISLQGISLASRIYLAMITPAASSVIPRHRYDFRFSRNAHIRTHNNASCKKVIPLNKHTHTHTHSHSHQGGVPFELSRCVVSFLLFLSSESPNKEDLLLYTKCRKKKSSRITWYVMQ